MLYGLECQVFEKKRVNNDYSWYEVAKLDGRSHKKEKIMKELEIGQGIIEAQTQEKR